MATGIVAYGCRLLRVGVVADLLLGVAALAWAGLALSVTLGLAQARPGLRAQRRRPAILSWVAATGVLAANLLALGWRWPAAALTALAAALLLWLLPSVWRNWPRPTRGTSFLLTVALESVAGMLGLSGATFGALWLLALGGALWLLGLLAYLYVLREFDWTELGSGRGDHWVAGGALAIAALTAGELYVSLGSTTLPIRPGGPLPLAVLVPWCLASAFIGLLLISEVVRPRWRFHGLRWATVFPVGMYGVASLGLQGAVAWAPLETVGRVWVWLGLGCWLVVGAGTLLVGLGRLPAWAASELEEGGPGSGPS